MKNRTSIIVLLSIAMFLGLTQSALAQQPPTSASNNDFIIRAAASEIAGVLARHGLTEVGRLDPAPTGEEVCVVRADPSVVPAQIISDVVSAEPSVVVIEEVFLASLPETTGNVVLSQSIGEILGALGDTSTVLFGKDSLGADRYVWTGYVQQDADNLVRASSARTVETGDGAVVAIIDSGIDPNHALFDGHLVPGYDFLLEQAGDASEWSVLDQSSMAILGQSSMAILGSDDVLVINQSSMAILGNNQINQLDPTAIPEAFGHGTMVAGIVHLVAPEAKIMPLRVFDGDGRANVFDVVRAIYYAVDHGATVINMSFSLEIPSQELITAMDYADQNGVSVVASVGNEGLESMVFPAGLCNVFGVGSTDTGDYVSAFSNLGNDLVTLAAPGENVITVYPGGGWAGASGTSFAAPWVSGAVALLADAKGDGTAGSVGFSQVDNALSYADPIFGSGAAKCGDGRVDIRAALDNLSQLPATGSSGCSGSSNAFPSATITAPAGGSTATVGDSVAFTGSASDVEDGDLTSALVWTSDIDGVIGSGGSFSTSVLSAGTHTITAAATDSVLLTGSTTVTIQVAESFIAVADTYIDASKTDKNLGDETDIRLKADSGKQRRSLLQFDLSTVPSSATVTSAKLELYVTRKKVGVTVNVHRLTKSWSEGTGVDTAGADWGYSDEPTSWTNSGGDFDATASGSLVTSTTGVYVDADVTALVQAWVDGTFANHGFLVDATGGNGEIKFHSREAVGFEPRLVIVYK